MVSTISEEIKRNKNKRGVYDPNVAAHKAYVRRKYAKFQGMKIVAHPELRRFVETGLREGRSPASIAGRIRAHEKHLPSISGDSIERFLKSVHGRKIEALRKRQQSLRHHRKKRRPLGILDGRTFIDVHSSISGQSASPNVRGWVMLRLTSLSRDAMAMVSCSLFPIANCVSHSLSKYWW